VVPADEMPVLAQGRLDPRLFDVSTLASTGYDDASRVDPPLLGQYRKSQVRTTGLAADNVRELGALNLVSMSQPHARPAGGRSSSAKVSRSQRPGASCSRWPRPAEASTRRSRAT
jgi:hypothetical protein